MLQLQPGPPRKSKVNRYAATLVTRDMDAMRSHSCAQRSHISAQRRQWSMCLWRRHSSAQARQMSAQTLHISCAKSEPLAISAEAA